MDLYKLFRFVQKLGGTQRVTNNNQWRIVAKKLGFETNWCVNQVKVIYRRYLHSFEELYRTLGCTLINHPRNSRADRSRHGSGRPLMRGVRTGSREKEDDGSDKSSRSSQEELRTLTRANSGPGPDPAFDLCLDLRQDVKELPCA